LWQSCRARIAEGNANPGSKGLGGATRTNEKATIPLSARGGAIEKSGQSFLDTRKKNAREGRLRGEGGETWSQPQIKLSSPSDVFSKGGKKARSYVRLVGSRPRYRGERQGKEGEGVEYKHEKEGGQTGFKRS